MNKKLKVAIAAATLVTVGTISGVMADSVEKEITAYLKPGVTIMVNGQKLDAKDANGNKVIPVNYNGTTMLPARAIADALNLPVEYDASTQTVWIGKKDLAPAKLIDLPITLEDTREFGIAPVKNKEVLTVDTADLKEPKVYSYGFHCSKVSYGPKTEIKLGKKYTKLKFSVFAKMTSDGTTTTDLGVNLKMYDKATNVSCFSKVLKDNEYITDTEVDVTGVDVLVLQADIDTTEYSLSILEPTVE